MFGFSLQKLVILALIIAAVWLGFRFLGRVQAQRKADAKAARKMQRRNRWSFGRDPDEDMGAEDMIACRVCDAYVPARGARSCGRADCPY
ncbi:MAG TPA: hypothetical protein VF274_01080 [Alphaproteobacteria bacterium]